jgi:thioredoxin reductase (NADPH)
MEKHDLIVIGIGPGGLTAGIYAARYKMDFILIGETPGGYAASAHDIRNYPGFPKVTGMELTMKMMDHAKSLDIPIKTETVQDLKKTEEGIIVKTNKGEYLGKKIILTTGSERKKLGLNKEKEFVGKGISYCATCDAGFQKGKTVGVVGGGDAALTAALLISKFAEKVYIFYRKEKFTKPEVSWIKDVEANDKIEVKFNSEIEELLLELENGSIKVDSSQRTNVPGVFAAGDVTNRPFKQIISAAGDAATALSTAFKELEKEKSGK